MLRKSNDIHSRFTVVRLPSKMISCLSMLPKLPAAASVLSFLAMAHSVLVLNVVTSTAGKRVSIWEKWRIV